MRHIDEQSIENTYRVFEGGDLVPIAQMLKSFFEDIVAKYVRTRRICLDFVLKSRLGQVLDRQRVDKDMYLQAMERSPINDLEIRTLLGSHLTSDTDKYKLIFKGIEQLYYYASYRKESSL